MLKKITPVKILIVLSMFSSCNKGPLTDITLSANQENTSTLSLLSTTYNVGPSRTYKKLQDVSGLLNPGDLVLLDGDATYAGGASFTRTGTAIDRIVIRGVKVNGKRPVINGGTKNSIEVYNANYYSFESLEISNAPKAGIGVYGDQIEIRDCIIHDSYNGIIGWGQYTGSVLLEYTEIYNCGREPVGNLAMGHGVYMATDEILFPNAVFRMQFCYVHNGAGGNNVKTRSGRNEIYYNWIEGAFHHALELIGPDPADNRKVKPATKREDSDVAGNVLVVTDGGAGVRVGGDGTGYTDGRYRMVNNTFILNGACDGVRTYTRLQTIEMHNNAFYNKVAAAGTRIIDDATVNWTSGRQVIGSNNWIQTGSTMIPSEFTGTVLGTDPGFTNITSNNVMLSTTSPLINVGNPSPATIGAYPFPSPLFPPTMLPPMQSLLIVATASTRPVNGTIDIGAYEF